MFSSMWKDELRKVAKELGLKQRGQSTDQLRAACERAAQGLGQQQWCQGRQQWCLGRQLQAVESGAAAVVPVSDSAGGGAEAVETISLKSDGVPPAECAAPVLVADAEDGSRKGAEQSVKRFRAMRKMS